MHSAFVRIQNVFGFFTTVAGFVATAIALSVLITPQSPTASLTMRDVKVYVVSDALITCRADTDNV
jgi:signal peptidase complex subunit 3